MNERNALNNIIYYRMPSVIKNNYIYAIFNCVQKLLLNYISLNYINNVKINAYINYFEI